MTRAIFIKEWFKTRRCFFICLVLALCFAAYLILSMNRVSVNKGVDHIWLIMLMKDNLFVEAMKYLPVVIAVALAIAQMAPEMTQKRLKLTLHLPYPQTRLVVMMLLTGVVELLVIYLIQLAAIAIYDATFLPHELTSRVVLSTLPWYVAGLTAYFVTSAICLEGSTRRKVVLGLLGVCALYPFFVQPAPEAYNCFLPWLVIFAFAMALLAFCSIYRFKEGVQD
ncbi:MAG: hypothetical protein IK120_03510 [Muribaculaceae bacterium]|nr:hypothetical protein [Muribaculaceae bacterium]